MHLQYLLIGLILISGSAYALNTETPAPNFSLPILANLNQSQSLNDEKGKVILVDFWAAWCGPCRKSMPLLERLYNNHKDQGFTILAISLDDNAKAARNFASQFQISYPLLLDTEATVADTYGVVGMPTSYLIDRDGILIWKHQGFKPKDMEKITQRVKQALAK